MEYSNKVFSLANPKAIVGIVILTTLLIYCFRKSEKDRLVLFSMLWFLITLLPQSNIYPLNAYMAEHWLYLPSIAFFIILARCLILIYKNLKNLGIIFITGLLILYSYLTIKQNQYWSDPVILDKITIKRAPDSPRAYNDLGCVYDALNMKGEAITAYKKALQITPDYPEIYYNLANTYASLDKTEEAIASYKKALEIKPNYPEAYCNMANVYFSLNNTQEALGLYKKALEINPKYAVAYSNMGNLFLATDKLDQAIDLYKKAISIDSQNAEAYNNLGVAYCINNEYENAEKAYKKAIEINPEYAQAHANLARVYYYSKQFNLAAKHCSKALELGCKVDPELLRMLEPYTGKPNE
jgi:tetratricopeptide (TPR) repeat protein